MLSTLAFALIGLALGYFWFFQGYYTERPAHEESRQSATALRGQIGYPSEYIPPLRIYAIRADLGSAQHYKIETEPNQRTFSFDNLEPGVYYLVAYVSAIPNRTGGYTQFVVCGLSVHCTDHALLPVTVERGEIVDHILLADWYADEALFPPEPHKENQL